MTIQVPGAHLTALLHRHGGNRTAIHRAEGWSLNTVRRLVKYHGLVALADGLAAETARSGPRRWASDEAVSDDRERVVVALARGKRQAAHSLGISPATLYRRIRDYGITAEEVAACSRPRTDRSPAR